MKVKKILFLLTIISLLAACADLTLLEQKSTGSIAIITQEQGENSSVASARNLYSYSGDIHRYEALLVGPGDNVNLNWFQGETAEVTVLEPGSWTVTVTAYDASDQALCAGNDSVSVSGGITTSATITLSPITGSNGSITLEINWPSTMPVASGTLSLDGMTAVPFDNLDTTTSFQGTHSFADVPPPLGHHIQISLNASDSSLLYGTTVTVHVTAGVNTPISLNVANYINPPGSPGTMWVDHKPFAAVVNWGDSDGEKGYFIEKKLSFETETEWSILDLVPADSVSYIDLKVESNTAYDYRVTAYNDNGETAAVPFSYTTPELSDDIRKAPVAFGESNAYRIDNSGNVIAYGINGNGQLGTTDPSMNSAGIQVPGLSNIVAVKSNVSPNEILFAIDNEGGLWRWGYQNPGDDYIPSQVLGITRPVIDFTLSYGSFYALDAEGNIWSWGANGNGQLGHNSTAGESSPRIIENLPEMFSIAAGGRHFIASATDGRLFSCGYNISGQLGLGDTSDRIVITEVPSITDATWVFSYGQVNSNISFYISSNNGELFATGNNSGDNLGISGASSYTTFTQVPNLSQILSVQFNYDATLALDNSGVLWGTGSQIYGSLLDNPASNTEFQVISSAPSQLTSLHGAGNKVYVQDNSAISYTWGSNLYGELMDSSRASGVTAEPVSYTHGDRFVQIVAGANHYLALDETGNVWAWGVNLNGQLGKGDTTGSDEPVQVSGLPTGDVKEIAVFNNNSAALCNDGSIYIWGEKDPNNIIASSSITTPVLFSGISGTTVEISVGADHWLALLDDGTLWAWGDNSAGQLGNNNLGVDSSTAVQVLDNTGAVPLMSVLDFNARNNFSNALLSDGTVVSWGETYLGTGSTGPAPLPVIANDGTNDLSNVTKLFAGERTVMAIVDGDLWKWGWLNSTSIIFNNDSTPVFYDVDNTPALEITKIVFGKRAYDTAFFLFNDGSVRVRGDGRYGCYGTGQIHNGSQWYAPDLGGATIIDIAISDDSAIALDSGGNLYAWGMDHLGQFGDGVDVQRPEFFSVQNNTGW